MSSFFPFMSTTSWQSEHVMSWQSEYVWYAGGIVISFIFPQSGRWTQQQRCTVSTMVDAKYIVIDILAREMDVGSADEKVYRYFSRLGSLTIIATVQTGIDSGTHSSIVFAVIDVSGMPSVENRCHDGHQHIWRAVYPQSLPSSLDLMDNASNAFAAYNGLGVPIDSLCRKRRLREYLSTAFAANSGFRNTYR